MFVPLLLVVPGVYVQDGKPFFGICLGLQLLFEGSDESGGHEGLGVIKGKVRGEKGGLVCVGGTGSDKGGGECSDSQSER